MSQIVIADNRKNYRGRMEYRLVLRPGEIKNYVIQRTATPELEISWGDVMAVSKDQFLEICDNHWLMNPDRDQSAALHDYASKTRLEQPTH